MTDITLLLEKIQEGEQQATDELLPLVYAELQKLAESKMRNERADHTLQSTALVNEAYIRLVQNAGESGWDGKSHFLSAAAEAMRRILVEHARRKLGKQRGGDRKRLRLDDVEQTPFATATNDPSLVLDIQDAIEQLVGEDTESVELIKLRYFCGLSMEEAAKTCEIPVSSAYAKWQYAKARLIQLLPR